MTKTDETFEEAVLALRNWLTYLDEQEKKYREQLERARRKTAEAAPAAVETVADEDKAPAEDDSAQTPAEQLERARRKTAEAAPAAVETVADKDKAPAEDASAQTPAWL
jgi:hypothetical protein